MIDTILIGLFIGLVYVAMFLSVWALIKYIRGSK